MYSVATFAFNDLLSNKTPGFFVKQNLFVVFTSSGIYVSLGSCYYFSWLALIGLISLYVAVLGNSTGGFSCSWIGFFSLRTQNLSRIEKGYIGFKSKLFFLSQLLHSVDYLVSQKNTAEKAFNGYKIKENPTQMSQRYQWNFSYTYPHHFLHGFPVQYILSHFLLSA